MKKLIAFVAVLVLALVASGKPTETMAAPFDVEIIRGTGWDITINLYNDGTGVPAVTLNIDNARNKLRPNEWTVENIERVVSDLLQREVDTTILLTDLPIDDPDRTIDPNGAGLFHSRIDPDREIGRGAQAEDIWSPTNLSRPNGLPAGIGGTATHLTSRPYRIEWRYVGTGTPTLDPADWNAVSCLASDLSCDIIQPPGGLP